MNTYDCCLNYGCYGMNKANVNFIYAFGNTFENKYVFEPNNKIRRFELNRFNSNRKEVFIKIHSPYTAEILVLSCMIK
jgi:hypothetical protein